MISGVFILIEISWAPYLFTFAMGLVIYAVINSAGYYAQKKQWIFVLMFGTILTASVILVMGNLALM